MVANNHMWLLSTFNVASELLTLYSLMNLNLNPHLWLVAALMGNEALVGKQTKG